ncbi:hypothetical protein EMN47_16345 [Prolixibacteraceae bacterium JC049]|nr:hypothetical protein [Prolixibacteraceae bacterium JC049]
MKYKITTLLCLIAFAINAQDLSEWRIGSSYLFTYEKYENDRYDERGSFFIEKPFRFDFLKNLEISPGINFKQLYENYTSRGLGAGIHKEVKHYSLGVYTKATYSILNSSSMNLYFGGLLATHIYTEERGTYSSWPVSGKYNNNGNKSRAYNDIYYAGLIGFEWKTKSWIHPSFEVRYLPDYAKNNYDKIQFIELALQFRLKNSN